MACCAQFAERCVAYDFRFISFYRFRDSGKKLYPSRKKKKNERNRLVEGSETKGEEAVGCVYAVSFAVARLPIPARRTRGRSPSSSSITERVAHDHYWVGSACRRRYFALLLHAVNTRDGCRASIRHRITISGARSLAALRFCARARAFCSGVCGRFSSW